MSGFWKLIPLGAIFAISVLVLSTASDRPVAEAAVTGVNITPTSFVSGTTVEFEVTASTSSADITVEASGAATGESLTILGCTPECSEEDGDTGASVVVATNGITTITLTLTATCNTTTTVTVRATQGLTDDEDTIDCVPVPNLTIKKAATGATANDTFAFTIDGTSTECDASFSLAAGAERGFTCDSPGSYTIIETASTTWGVSSITCTDVGIPDADIVVTLADRKVVVTLGSAGDSAVCTFTNALNATATPTVTPTATTVPGAGTVTVSASPNSVGCTGSSFVAITVKTAGGANVADGTNVTITTSIGSISPSTATTFGGGILAVYTAPATSGGNANITATAGGVSGSASINVSCTSAPPPANTPVPPAAQPTATSPIRPPNTGDAGIGGGHDSNQVYAGIALITMAVVGVMVATRKRA